MTTFVCRPGDELKPASWSTLKEVSWSEFKKTREKLKTAANGYVGKPQIICGRDTLPLADEAYVLIDVVATRRLAPHAAR